MLHTSGFCASEVSKLTVNLSKFSTLEEITSSSAIEAALKDAEQQQPSGLCRLDFTGLESWPATSGSVVPAPPPPRPQRLLVHVHQAACSDCIPSGQGQNNEERETSD